jgi:endoglucanase
MQSIRNVVEQKEYAMSRSFLLRAAGLLALLVLFSGAFWIQPVASFFTHVGAGTTSAAHAAAAPRLTFHQYANGPYKVSGNQVIGADGQPYIFHGVGRDGYQFSCIGGGYTDAAHLAFMGPGTSSSSGTYWFANTVRLNLSQAIWLNGISNQCTAAQYQSYVKQTVDTLTSMNLNVVIDLMSSDADGQAPVPGGGYQMPDARSVTFWQQVAPIYASYSNVLFEVFNEPHPTTSSSDTNPWQCWQSGKIGSNNCQITNDQSVPINPPYNYTAVGIQTLVNTVRAHANNLVLVAGLNWGFDLSQLNTYPITGSNIVYDTHPYNYSGKNNSSEWDAAFGYLTSTVPVVSAESGEYDCGVTQMMSALISYFDAHSMGWIAYAWWVQPGSSGCGYPQLISDFQGTPLASMGTYIYQHFLAYASQSNIPMPVGPVNKTWYFSEGRVGGNFKEFLSLEDPTSNACSVNITYLAQPDRGSPYTKNVTVNVPANTRVEEMANTDLGLPSNGTGSGISDSAIVTVNANSTPNCTGIVAERPMYFNFNNGSTSVSSGSDVIGMTKLGTTFYIGDMAVGAQPGGGSYASYLTILNPPGSSTAAITATYYANGQKVGQQSVNVAGGTRGTINPAQASPALPARVAVVVTSNQPVAVERPTYFANIAGGNAGTVSGAADVIGVQGLSNDWLFAEGYTGGKFQENLVVANVDPANATANVTVTLEFPNGTTKTSQFNVASDSQYVYNVNGQAGGQSVSAEITSSGAKIVAEREMFFLYNHAANGRNLNATGGTDVLGQNGPAAMSNYSFAEGYVNVGYDEWLTIQNPTGSSETITIGLVNAKGTTYVFTLSVGAHTRSTVDITGTVIQHLYHSGDGFYGYEVAMVVQSSSGPFVAERPMYWNTAGTQGGSDVIGYPGG